MGMSWDEKRRMYAFCTHATVPTNAASCETKSHRDFYCDCSLPIAAAACRNHSKGCRERTVEQPLDLDPPPPDSRITPRPRIP